MEFSQAQLEQWRKEYWGQRRQLVLALVFTLVSILIFVMGGQQISGMVRQTNLSIRREKDALNKIQRRVKLIEEISSDDRSAFEQAARAMPGSKQPLAILRSLEAIAEENQMSIGHYDLNPGLLSTEEAVLAEKKKQEEGIESFVIKLEMTGSFNNLLSSLQEIEQTLPLMEVTTLTISPMTTALNEDIGSVPYRAELQVRSFFALLDAAKIVEAARSSGTIQFSDENAITAELIAPLEFRLDNAVILQNNLPDFSNTDVFGTQVPLLDRQGLPLSPSPSPTPEASGSGSLENTEETEQPEGTSSSP